MKKQQGAFVNPREIPVLLLIFNRMDTAEKVMDVVRTCSPRHLYLASDGGRNPEEHEQVVEIRHEISRSIDWDCQVRKRFRDNNLGCRDAVSDALDWFFDAEEMGIVLEDDCLPDPFFFDYCATMLSRFRCSRVITTISGSRPRSYRQFTGSGSGELSKVFHCWGWASWRRAWEKVRCSALPKVADVEAKTIDNEEKRYWTRVVYELESEKVDSWAYRLSLQSFLHDMRHIIPAKNLVVNIGFGGKGTHTNHPPIAAARRIEPHPYFNLEGQINEPSGLDNEYFRSCFRGLPIRMMKRFRYTILDQFQ